MIESPVYPHGSNLSLSLDFSRKDLEAVKQTLAASETLELQPNAKGLYPASPSQAPDAISGYQHAWIRDNVQIAFSFFKRGEIERAACTVRALTAFLLGERHRFEAILRNPLLKEHVNERPHVRFDAFTLHEIRAPWAHAQNDALGYVLWLRFLLANVGCCPLNTEELELYGLFPRYFRAIEYWSDPDSGCWEESRKINCSSVGTVMAGLRELQKYLAKSGSISTVTPDEVQFLIDRGKLTLKALPFESPPQRGIDAALLFLIYPLEIVSERELQNLILNLVKARLEGPHGIRRYIGDSYFCQDYDLWFPEIGSSDFSDRIEIRDEFLKPGREAQWCLFDPLLSVIYGRLHEADRSRTDCREKQIFHFNRSLSQLTPGGQCPELYYLRRGVYTPNAHTPLGWTQANLALAVHYLDKI
ncbi:MAG: glycoside hydrolase family 15 protein [Bryobacteraceae bacterium]